MSEHLKSVLYRLMITGCLFIMLAGCDIWKGKPDAVIEIDLTKPGKSLHSDAYNSSEDTTHLQSAGNLKASLEVARKMIVMENQAIDSNNSEQINHPGSTVSKSGHPYFSPSYYAVKLFMDNKPDKVIPTKVTMRSTDTAIIATAGVQEKAGLVIIKMVNQSSLPKNCRIVLNYYLKIKYKGEVTVMTSKNIKDENTVKNPEKVVPMTDELNGLTNTFNYKCPGNSVVIIKVRYRKGINGFGNCC